MKYTAVITEKKILEQHEHILLTVELTGDTPIVPEVKKDKDGNEIPEYIMDGDQPKLDKDGNPKVKAKETKPKLPTTTIYFKFPIDTDWSTMKADIKKRIDSIEKAEGETIPMNTPINFSTK